MIECEYGLNILYCTAFNYLAALGSQFAVTINYGYTPQQDFKAARIPESPIQL